MKGTFTVIKADGSSATQPVDRAPDYKMIKHGLDGGSLEIVPYFSRYKGERCVAFCDEDGKNKGLPYNRIVTDLWFDMEPRAIGVDYLVGPIVIVSGDDDLLREL